MNLIDLKFYKEKKMNIGTYSLKIMKPLINIV